MLSSNRIASCSAATFLLFDQHVGNELVAQRVYGLALGNEDLNDRDELRKDPLVAVLVGKSNPQGEDRIQQRGQGKAMAGKSTLNRLELTSRAPAKRSSGTRRL